MKTSFKILFVTFIYSIILSSVIYFFSIDNILPRVLYKNIIEFNLAYINYEDVVSFHRVASVDSETSKLTFSNVERSPILKKYVTDVPYQYVPYFGISFGNDHPINFALSGLKINNNIIPLSVIADELKKIGYEVKIENDIVYANFVNVYDVLNLYAIAKDSFIFMSQEEVNNYIKDDEQLRCLYFIFLVISCLFLFRILFSKLRMLQSVFPRVYIFCCTYLLLFAFSIVLENRLEITESYINIIYLVKNYLCLMLLPIVLFLIGRSLKFALRFILFLFAFIFLFEIGIDHFVQNIFGTRFLFDSVGTFAGSIIDSIPFLISYFTNCSGIFFVCSLIFFSIFYWDNTTVNRKVFCAILVLFVVSVILSFTFNSKDNMKFYNSFQVNINGLYTTGDYKREYLNYPLYEKQDLKYVTNAGLNQKKDVIVILVESLSCEVTYACGNSYDYMPTINQLASDNVFFSSYYSNNINTNGAIFTITTGFPHIYSANSSRSYTNNVFYDNDLIDKFHANGYVTSYYSPAKFVLGKDEQLKMSQYDYLSSSNDKYYDKFAKPGVFDSVSDGDMFNKIIEDLKRRRKEPSFIMLTTVSTHTPYINPWGTQNIERAYAYTDFAINQFISDLKSINYFDNGIVVITGDHRGWGSNDQMLSNKAKSRISREKIPLIIIDGIHHNVLFDKISFSHSSLAVLLEYMMLPTYDVNKYQVNPLLSERDEVILCSNLNNANTVIVKYGSKEDNIILDGDKTRFEGDSFTEEEQKSILGYLTWLRQ